jgi:hypothetical protein
VLAVLTLIEVELNLGQHMRFELPLQVFGKVFHDPGTPALSDRCVPFAFSLIPG